jgi:hypothetical protein
LRKEGLDWIHLAQDMDQWWAFVDTVMNLLSSIKGGKCLDKLSNYQLLKNYSAYTLSQISLTYKTLHFTHLWVSILIFWYILSSKLRHTFPSLALFTDIKQIIKYNTFTVFHISNQAQNFPNKKFPSLQQIVQNQCHRCQAIYPYRFLQEAIYISFKIYK